MTEQSSTILGVAESALTGAGTENKTVTENKNEQTQGEIKDKPLTVVQTPIVPDKYELTLPEGSLLKPDYIDKFSAYAKEKKLSNEQAQELLNGRHETVKEYNDSQWKMVEDVKVGWIEKGKTDTEFGGANYEKNIGIAVEEAKRFMSPEFKRVLDESGMGNHPEVIRVFLKYAKLIKEKDELIAKLKANDGFVKGSTGAVNEVKPLHERMYPPKN